MLRRSNMLSLAVGVAITAGTVSMLPTEGDPIQPLFTLTAFSRAYHAPGEPRQLMTQDAVWSGAWIKRYVADDGTDWAVAAYPESLMQTINIPTVMMRVMIDNSGNWDEWLGNPSSYTVNPDSFIFDYILESMPGREILKQGVFWSCRLPNPTDPPMSCDPTGWLVPGLSYGGANPPLMDAGNWILTSVDFGSGGLAYAANGDCMDTATDIRELSQMKWLPDEVIVFRDAVGMSQVWIFLVDNAGQIIARRQVP